MIIVGTPEECLEKILRYDEAASTSCSATCSSATLPHEKVMRSLELLGTKVIPELEKRGHRVDARDRRRLSGTPWTSSPGSGTRPPTASPVADARDRPLLSDELVRQFSLEGRTAVVTGAAGGIGRQAALTFTEAGADVVIADVGEDGLEETAELVDAAGGEGHRRAHRRRRPRRGQRPRRAPPSRRAAASTCGPTWPASSATR